MKKFLLNTTLVFLLSVIFLSVWGKIIDKGLRETRYFYYAQWNDIYDGSVDVDLIILGSSRAVGHYDPKILETSMQLSAYNIGMNGYGASMLKCRYDIFMANNKTPKIAIIDVDDVFLGKRPGLYQKEQFAPYFSDSIMTNTIKSMKGFHKYDYQNPFTKYTFQKDSWIGVVELLGLHTSFDGYKGFHADPFVMDAKSEMKLLSETHPDGVISILDANEKQCLEQMIVDMKASNILPILVYSPQYLESFKLYNTIGDVLLYYEEIQKKYNVPYLFYGDDEISISPLNFKDHKHLNKQGSELFSSKLAHDLKSIIK